MKADKENRRWKRLTITSLGLKSYERIDSVSSVGNDGISTTRRHFLDLLSSKLLNSCHNLDTPPLRL